MVGFYLMSSLQRALLINFISGADCSSAGTRGEGISNSPLNRSKKALRERPQTKMIYRHGLFEINLY